MDETNSHEYKGDWTEMAKKSTRSVVQVSLSTTVHPLFKVAIDIIAHIYDYPTLARLAMTCRTFHSLIHDSQTTIPMAFENLERQRRPKEIIGRELGSSPCNMMDQWTWMDCNIRDPKDLFNTWTHHYIDDAAQCGDGEVCNFDLLRHDTGLLPSCDWLPCYGCMRIKRKITHFFHEQTQDHRGLLGCQATSRRCIDCSIAEKSRFAKPYRYLQDMPRTYAGFRLRCSQCRNVEWVLRRPKGKQREKKLCSGCIGNLRFEVRPMHSFMEEWQRLVAIQINPSSSANRAGRRVGWTEELTYESSPPPSPLPCQSFCRFEILKLDRG